MYIKLSTGCVVNTNAVVVIENSPAGHYLHLVDGKGPLEIKAVEYENLAKILSLQGNLLDMREANENIEGLDALINYRNNKHQAGHQIIKMMKEFKKTIADLEEAEQVDKMFKEQAQQQAFDFTGKAN